MKIVVVEDETSTREGIIRIIDQHTEHTVIGQASNGEHGKTLILETMPDVIITDVQMPQCSGLRMLSDLQEEDYIFDSIILSGFSDFEYARSALKLGVQEYLLKPITVQDLKICLNTIEQKRSEEQITFGTVQEMVTLLLSSHDMNTEKLINHLQLKLKMTEQTELCAVLIQSNAFDRESYFEIFHKIQMRLDMMCMEDCHIFNLPFGYGILLLCMNVQHQPLFEKQISDYVFRQLNTSANFEAASLRFSDLSNLEQIITQLQEMFRYALILESPQLITWQCIESFVVQELQYPNQIEKDMKQALYKNDRARMLECAEQFQHAMLCQCCEPREIVEGFLTFLSNLYTAMKELTQKPNINRDYHNCIQQLSNALSKEEFIQNYNKAIEMLISFDEKQLEAQNLIVIKVINYIRSHYAEEISLTQLADRMGVTPVYLSKLFHQEMNINFSSFLKHFRISCAKRLLLSGEYQIQQVAESVGFSDPKYFNRVFKEVCGQSPSEFKKKGG